MVRLAGDADDVRRLAAGPLQLTVTAWPWAGTRCRSTCTGFPANSIGFELIGFTSSSTPLSLLHPAGGPGCTLLVNAIATTLIFPVGGSVESDFGMPSDPAFTGVVLQHQVLQIELDASFTITHIGGSNGVKLTIGTY